MKRDRWVLGDAGQQAAIDQQYDDLAGDLLELYSNDFVTAWRDALGNLHLKKLLADKPKYECCARCRRRPRRCGKFWNRSATKPR